MVARPLGHTGSVPYDPAIADRLRAVLADEPEAFEEKRMFGGLAFLTEGRMAVAAGSHGGVLLRVDPQVREGLLDGDRVRPMVMQGRELAGWLDVRPEAVATDADLTRLVAVALEFTRTLPPR